MKAFKRLYLATTERDDIFKTSESINSKNMHIFNEDRHSSIGLHQKKEIIKNRAIYIFI